MTDEYVLFIMTTVHSWRHVYVDNDTFGNCINCGIGLLGKILDYHVKQYALFDFGDFLFTLCPNWLLFSQRDEMDDDQATTMKRFFIVMGVYIVVFIFAMGSLMSQLAQGQAM